MRCQGRLLCQGENLFREKFPEILVSSELADLYSKRQHPLVRIFYVLKQKDYQSPSQKHV